MNLIPQFISCATMVVAFAFILAIHPATTHAQEPSGKIVYKTAKIDGLDIFYREAGDPKKPAILLLHGFPASSHMFRDLIPRLSDKFHVVAPDYPGFGYSSALGVNEYDYTFDNLSFVIEKFIDTVGLKKFAIYVQDYGAPIGYRIAERNPQRITALIVQNGNAYDEGLESFWNPIRAYWSNPSKENAANLRDFLKLEATKWQYTHGTRNPENVAPDSYHFDQFLLDRPGNKDIQLKLFLDYRSNPPLYPKWQAYFREHQPPTLIVWGKNDKTFVAAGAEAYKRDLKNIDFHLLDTGHFALEEDSEVIAAHIRTFFEKQKIR
ncbi:MAG TPA: alpha/beta hydrolase [Pyrinomonadaceae bacterium]|nr:alpha/beta hydrolase [Pyrinomonadaceae bacterium]